MPGNRESQVPLLNRFRENFEERLQKRRNSNERVVDISSTIVAHRRRGLDENELKRSVTENIARIVNTIDLQSSVDVRPFDYVRKSILNFGLYDISNLTSEGERVALIEHNVIAAIVCYEPRIVRETIEVRRQETFDDVSQNLQISVRADIKSHPLDIEIELVADVDLSLGKVSVTRANSA